jgi:transcriptional regulator with PAS, ATPase and Fis domain
MDNWAEGLSEVAITVTDENGKFIDMNKCSKIVNLKDSSKTVVGKDISECHTQRSNDIIKHIVESHTPNVYTITKKGRKKLIYQSPWFKEDNSFGGLVEISIFLPDNIPHFDRDAKKEE